MNDEGTKRQTAETPDGRFPIYIKKHGDGFQASCFYLDAGLMFGAATSPPTVTEGHYERFQDDTEAGALEKLAAWVREKWGTKAQILDQPFLS